MDITPSYLSIGKLFERNILFEIPKYQRYYAWDDEQVDDFVEDIAALINQKDKQHFFGGIVCVEKKFLVLLGSKESWWTDNRE